jgi:class 3 adenylate cyclase
MPLTLRRESKEKGKRKKEKAKDYETDILVSQFVYEQVKNKFDLELVGEATLKGKSGTIKLYKVNREDYE